MRRTILLAALVLMLTAGVRQSSAKIRQLPPSAFPELPTNLVEELHRRECQIPHVQKRKRGNVIHGEFLKPGQADWAVLCSMKKYTSLLVLGMDRSSKLSSWQQDQRDSPAGRLSRPMRSS